MAPDESDTTQPPAKPLAYHETNAGMDCATRWYHMGDLLPLLRRLRSYSWIHDADLKYLGMRFDTRTGNVLLSDRHGTPIHVERLEALAVATEGGR